MERIYSGGSNSSSPSMITKYASSVPKETSVEIDSFEQNMTESRFTSMYNTIKLVIPEQKLFFSDEVIRGHVEVHARSVLICQKLLLKLKGKETISYLQFHEETNVFLEEIYEVKLPNTYKYELKVHGYILQPGIHRIPFQIKLPKFLPPSCETTSKKTLDEIIGSISYSLKVRLEQTKNSALISGLNQNNSNTVSKWTYSKQLPIGGTIFNSTFMEVKSRDALARTAMDSTRMSQLGEGDKEANVDCCLHVSKTIAHQGGVLDVGLEINNNSSKEVHTFGLKLVQRVNYLSLGKVVCTFDKKIQHFELEPVKPSEKVYIKKEFSVGEEIPENIFQEDEVRCSAVLMTIMYYVTVDVGLERPVMNLSIPIFFSRKEQAPPTVEESEIFVHEPYISNNSSAPTTPNPTNISNANNPTVAVKEAGVAGIVNKKNEIMRRFADFNHELKNSQYQEIMEHTPSTVISPTTTMIKRMPTQIPITVFENNGGLVPPNLNNSNTPDTRHKQQVTLSFSSPTNNQHYNHNIGLNITSSIAQKPVDSIHDNFAHKKPPRKAPPIADLGGDASTINTPPFAPSPVPSTVSNAMQRNHQTNSDSTPRRLISTVAPKPVEPTPNYKYLQTTSRRMLEEEEAVQEAYEDVDDDLNVESAAELLEENMLRTFDEDNDTSTQELTNAAKNLEKAVTNAKISAREARRQALEALSPDTKNEHKEVTFDEPSFSSDLKMDSSTAESILQNATTPEGSFIVPESVMDPANETSLSKSEKENNNETDELPTVVWINDDGSRYAGTILDGKKHGNGKYYYPDGSIYSGEYKSDVRHGWGILSTKNYTYDGEWYNDKKEGKGLMVYSSGEQYEGEFKDNVPEGEGEYIFADGSRYLGCFSNGLREGKGILIYSDSLTLYDGEWKADKKEGKATIKFVNGQYDGEMKNDVKEGFGVYKYKNGDVYEGYWQGNKKHGFATYTFADGSVFKGRYIGGVKHGTAIFVTTDGIKFNERWNMGKLIKKQAIS